MDENKQESAASIEVEIERELNSQKAEELTEHLADVESAHEAYAKATKTEGVLARALKGAAEAFLGREYSASRDPVHGKHSSASPAATVLARTQGSVDKSKKETPETPQNFRRIRHDANPSEVKVRAVQPPLRPLENRPQKKGEQGVKDERLKNLRSPKETNRSRRIGPQTGKNKGRGGSKGLPPISQERPDNESHLAKDRENYWDGLRRSKKEEDDRRAKGKEYLRRKKIQEEESRKKEERRRKEIRERDRREREWEERKRKAEQSRISRLEEDERRRRERDGTI